MTERTDPPEVEMVEPGCASVGIEIREVREEIQRVAMGMDLIVPDRGPRPLKN